jgi:hypothetical protein
VPLRVEVGRETSRACIHPSVHACWVDHVY